ncbi:hypothetical protein OBP_285 [Pseudomonas phage OBP]|uniref:hypothetical protein n=1 Tax=Pseudomonas phage OBP TaxID=1124849 RepID=UPI000240D638|nr:hypothetical protein OBP_285 [Pseudomonas phage OBP]AEV89722.1 hypothetical protein OBP_285 [Pseudomonas phage OBP]
MDHCTSLFTLTDDGKHYSLNLFVAKKETIDRWGIDLVKKLFKAYENKQLLLATDIGAINVGSVEKVTIGEWGSRSPEEVEVTSVTASLLVEKTDISNYLYNNNIRISAQLVPTAHGLSSVVHISKVVNFGKNYNLSTVVGASHATRK